MREWCFPEWFPANSARVLFLVSVLFAALGSWLFLLLVVAVTWWYACGNGAGEWR
jgi:hypothetical protein